MATSIDSRDPIERLPRNGSERPSRARRRAPRRAGRRAQLTVPEEMWREVAWIAELTGTTPNDVLVQLAGERLQERGRALELQSRAEERWQAFLAAAPPPDASAPMTEQELIELSGALRNDA